MRTYDVHVSRDRKWFMVCIPAITGLTQAYTWEEVPVMARDYIAVWNQVPPHSFKIRISKRSKSEWHRQEAMTTP